MDVEAVHVPDLHEWCFFAGRAVAVAVAVEGIVAVLFGWGGDVEGGVFAEPSVAAGVREE